MSLEIHTGGVLPAIGRYRLVAPLSRGELSNVYFAVAPTLDGAYESFALKVLRPELNEDELFISAYMDHVTTFLERARFAARLVHPNIVATTAVASDHGHHYAVMEYVDGCTLQRLFKKLAGNPAFSVGARLLIIAGALRALEYAHTLHDCRGIPLKIVHRRLSPETVMFTFDGATKVLGFGAEESVETFWHDAEDGTKCGPRRYLAPEQREGLDGLDGRGARDVDLRADLYAVGVMAWEAISGRRLWEGMNASAIARRSAVDDPPRLSTVCAGISADVDNVCARAIARNPDARYPSSTLLRHDLELHLMRRTDVPNATDLAAAVAEAFADERHILAVARERATAQLHANPRQSGLSYVGARTKLSRDDGSEPTRTDPTSVRPTVTSLSGSTDIARWLAPPTVPPPATPAGRGEIGRTGRVLQGSLPRSLGSWALAGGAAVTGVMALAMAVSPAGKGPRALPGVGASLQQVRRPPAAATEAASAPLDPVAILPAAPLPVELSVRVSPIGAQITIDGTEVVSNPFRGRLPHDSGMRQVVATAPGFKSKELAVSFAQDIAVDISLERQAAAQHVRSARASSGGNAASPMVGQENVERTVPPVVQPSVLARPAGPADEVKVDPGGGVRPLRPIVTANPYASPVATANPYEAP